MGSASLKKELILVFFFCVLNIHMKSSVYRVKDEEEGKKTKYKISNYQKRAQGAVRRC